VRVVTRLVESIRAEDPRRLIIADGLRWGREPVYGLARLGVAQSTRGYEPMQISHYRASWIGGSDKWPEPTWPLKAGENRVVNRETLAMNDPTLKQLEKRRVHVRIKIHTPCTKLCLLMGTAWRVREAGWALWSVRRSGLDSALMLSMRTSRGCKPDRQMLTYCNRLAAESLSPTRNQTVFRCRFGS
jgi:endoglucanase